MMRHIKHIISSVIILLSVVSVSAGVKARIAGLQSNEEYMQLLVQSDSIAVKESALALELRKNRKLYSDGGSKDEALRAKVVALEQSLFDLRASKSGVVSKINSIEQRWVLDHMDNKTTPPTEQSKTTKELTTIGAYARSISQSLYVHENLPRLDIKNLQDAETAEREVVQRVGSFVSNYNELSRLKNEYSQVESESVADSIMRRYYEVDSLNNIIEDRMAHRWAYVFDNKSFAYALLMEKLGNKEIFERDENLKIKAARMIDSLRDASHSTSLLSYHANRLSLVELELSLAEKMRLNKAVDSLKVVRDSLRLVEFNYPVVSITKRLFLLYEPIQFSTEAVYTGKNPIPDGKIYDRGVMYRILLGSYQSRQAASIFRGAYPLSIIKNSWGLLGYYAGGYATQAEAEEARAMLLKKGFKRPEVVEWRDGEMRNLTKEPRVSTSKYRVEINGLSELTSDIKSVIETQSSGRELSKAGATTFVIGIFDDKESATHLMESLKIIDDKIKVSVVEVTR